MNTAPRHVIFETSAIGLTTLDALRRRGEKVRMINRSGTAAVPEDAEVIRGDARDPHFTTAVTGPKSSPRCRRACSPWPRPPAPGRRA
jgi:hypothetical protein